MRNRAVRAALFGLFLVAVGVAAYLFWIGESKAREEEQAALAFDGSARAAARALTDLRLAQQGYVAAGQGDQFWASKADEAAAAVRDALTRMRTGATAAGGQTDIETATSAFQDLLQLDGRARDYARSGQKLLASDLIFSDGLEMTRAALTAIEQARSTETEAHAAAVRTVHKRQLYALGAAACAAMLIVVLLVPVGASPTVSIPASVGEPTADRIARSDEALDLGNVDTVEGWSAPRRAEPATQAEAAPASPEPLPPEPPPPPGIDIGGVAALCTELARVGDTRALPAALERAASVLDAAGIVLWIADPDGRELAPIVAHGYPQQLIARLGTIGRDAENATAAAFRTSLLQTVNGDATSNGAIVAPLLAPTGCVGVMAAEMRNGGEQQNAKLAAATIVAAQLATLAGPPSSRAQSRGAEAAHA
jgi:hypothetical protein